VAARRAAQISRPGIALILTAAVLLLVTDVAYRQVSGDGVGPALLDETAHLMTGYLVLAALFRGAGWRFSVPLLAGSVLIDADHLPGALGYQFLTAGTQRPYTHSLLTLAALLIAAALWRHGRLPLLGLFAGVAFHFVRDLAERSHAGVALLWPFSDHPYSFPHGLYLAGIGLLTVLALSRAGLAARRPSAQVC
jgi:membrane-bound metal-dependent hydrolase YbcI (DUF457 family)